MELTTLILLTIACYWIYAYFKKQLKHFERLGIPYVPGWPLLGNMADPFLRRKHITETMRDIYNYNKEAKYVGAFDFIKPVIILRDPELIKNVTIKHFDNFPDHQNFVDSAIDPLFGGNLFSMAGDQWKETRSLLSPAFTSSKMKNMFELMIKCAENFNNYIAEQAKNPKNVIATKDLFTRFTSDVIATCVFGITVDSLKQPKNEFYVLGRDATNFEGSLSLKFFLSRAFPSIVKFFKIKIVSDHVGRFFTDLVRSTIKMRDEKGISRPDMIQLMMDARGKTSELLKLDITQMTAQAFVFFFGGFDTTSTQMCIVAHELTINPDIQKKLQDEIDAVLQKYNGKPTYEAINSMPYLDAVFNETMRKHSQANILDRLCTKAFELPPAQPGYKPFIVQPGTNMWIPVSAIHYDEQFYENPDKFDPERYMNKKVTINQVENLGFGIGPRSCIGNRFAILETKILFFFLLSKFNLIPNAKTCNPFIYDKSNLTIIAKGGYWLTFEARH